MPKDKTRVTDMRQLEDLLPHFRSHGVDIRWSSVYKDTLVAGTCDQAVYVTWEQIAYLADHGVRMTVMGFGKNNLTKHMKGAQYDEWTFHLHAWMQSLLP